MQKMNKLNEKKNDPEYYYLPDTWNGKHLEWEQPKDTKGYR